MRLVALVMVCILSAQAETAFDVVSIRPPARYGQSDVPNPMLGDLMGATYRFPDRVRFRGITVLQLLQAAFDVKYFQVAGPDWIGMERFDIAATHAPNPSNEEFQTMIRGMLVERFGLTLHHEIREFTAYRLTVAKGGPKLGEPVAPGRGPWGIPVTGIPVTGGFKVAGEGATIDQLLAMIEFEFKIRREPVPVTNETGLAGAFHFETTFAREDASLTPSAYPTLFQALESDLGLHLEKGKAHLDTIIVDHVERKPTQN